jgi:hypothetical protein
MISEHDPKKSDVKISNANETDFPKDILERERRYSWDRRGWF